MGGRGWDPGFGVFLRNSRGEKRGNHQWLKDLSRKIEMPTFITFKSTVNRYYRKRCFRYSIVLFITPQKKAYKMSVTIITTPFFLVAINSTFESYESDC